DVECITKIYVDDSIFMGNCSLWRGTTTTIFRNKKKYAEAAVMEFYWFWIVLCTAYLCSFFWSRLACCRNVANYDRCRAFEWYIFATKKRWIYRRWWASFAISYWRSIYFVVYFNRGRVYSSATI